MGGEWQSVDKVIAAARAEEIEALGRVPTGNGSGLVGVPARSETGGKFPCPEPGCGRSFARGAALSSHARAHDRGSATEKVQSRGSDSVPSSEGPKSEPAEPVDNIPGDIRRVTAPHVLARFYFPVTVELISSLAPDTVDLAVQVGVDGSLEVFES